MLYFSNHSSNTNKTELVNKNGFLQNIIHEMIQEEDDDEISKANLSSGEVSNNPHMQKLVK